MLAGGGALDGGLEGDSGMLHRPLSVRRPSMISLLVFLYQRTGNVLLNNSIKTNLLVLFHFM